MGLDKAEEENVLDQFGVGRVPYSVLEQSEVS
jgi:hypothetical protein